MSPATQLLSKPVEGKRIPETTLVYFRTRNRMRAFSAVHQEYEASGIDQKELGKRLGKSKSRISRLLGAPGNWTHDTSSDLLYAISGSEFEYTVGHPFDRPPRNAKGPEWIQSTPILHKGEGIAASGSSTTSMTITTASGEVVTTTYG